MKSKPLYQSKQIRVEGNRFGGAPVLLVSAVVYIRSRTDQETEEGADPSGNAAGFICMPV